MDECALKLGQPVSPGGGGSTGDAGESPSSLVEAEAPAEMESAPASPDVPPEPNAFDEGEYVENAEEQQADPEDPEMENGEIVEEVEEGETDDAEGELIDDVSPPPEDRQTQLERLRNMQFKSTRMSYPSREKRRDVEDAGDRSPQPRRAPPPPVQPRHQRSGIEEPIPKDSRHATPVRPSAGFQPPRDRSRERFEDEGDRRRKRRLEEDDYRERDRQRRRAGSPVYSAMPQGPPMLPRREPPATLRQRTQQLLDVADNRIMMMSKEEIVTSIRRACDLDLEHRRMIRGRQEQIKELKKLKQMEIETMERLLKDVPPHRRHLVPNLPNGIAGADLGQRPPFMMNGVHGGPPPPMANGRPPMFPPGMPPPGFPGGPPPHPGMPPPEMMQYPPGAPPPPYPGGPYGAPPPMFLAHSHIPPHIVVSQAPPQTAPPPQAAPPPARPSTPPAPEPSAPVEPQESKPLHDFSRPPPHFNANMPPPSMHDLSQPPPQLVPSSSMTASTTSTVTVTAKMAGPSSLPDFSMPPPGVGAPPQPNFQAATQTAPPPTGPPQGAATSATSGNAPQPQPLISMNRPPPGFNLAPSGKPSAPYMGGPPFPFPPPGAPPQGGIPSLIGNNQAPNPINLSRTLTSMIASAVGATPGGQPRQGPSLGNANPFGANTNMQPMRLVPNFPTPPQQPQQRTFTTTKVFNGGGKRFNQRKTPIKEEAHAAPSTPGDVADEDMKEEPRETKPEPMDDTPVLRFDGGENVSPTEVSAADEGEALAEGVEP